MVQYDIIASYVIFVWRVGDAYISNGVKKTTYSLDVFLLVGLNSLVSLLAVDLVATPVPAVDSLAL